MIVPKKANMRRLACLAVFSNGFNRSAKRDVLYGCLKKRENMHCMDCFVGQEAGAPYFNLQVQDCFLIQISEILLS